MWRQGSTSQLRAAEAAAVREVQDRIDAAALDLGHDAEAAR